jgi:trans-aconitate 2-methyltransferase
MPWDPARYNLFKQERSAPFEDLVKLVEVRPHLQVVDLGCGTGELTSRLAGLLPESQVLGIDSSPEMLRETAEHQAENLRFQPGLLEDLQGSWDLIFSNAAMQWVEDHPRLIARLFSKLKPGGQLAVQMPSNHTHLTHMLILELAGQEPFFTALSGWTRQPPVLSIDEYARLLYLCGGTDLLVFEKIYPHILANSDALANWTSGTALVPYLERLGAEMSELFLARYRAKLKQNFPDSPVFYPFRRILFSARRKD